MSWHGNALAAAILLAYGCNYPATRAEQTGNQKRLITLSGDYAYSYYSAADLPAKTVIDATRATWRLSSQNRHPFRIYGAGEDLVLNGGTILGEVSQTMDWHDIYALGNAAGIRVRHAPAVTISGWRVTNAWDAVRVEDGTNGWRIQGVHISGNRDDAVENDKLLSGTLADSLIDGTYSGISMDARANRDGSHNAVNLERVLMRLQPYLVDGKTTHGGPIKGEDDVSKYNPKLRFIDCVIAIEDVNHNMRTRTRIAWKNTIAARGSYYLNLSDTPLPVDYPLPPAGFTVLQGQAARAHWEASKSAWLKRHPSRI